MLAGNLASCRGEPRHAEAIGLLSQDPSGRTTVISGWRWCWGTRQLGIPSWEMEDHITADGYCMVSWLLANHLIFCGRVHTDKQDVRYMITMCRTTARTSSQRPPTRSATFVFPPSTSGNRPGRCALVVPCRATALCCATHRRDPKAVVLLTTIPPMGLAPQTRCRISFARLASRSRGRILAPCHSSGHPLVLAHLPRERGSTSNCQGAQHHQRQTPSP